MRPQKKPALLQFNPMKKALFLAILAFAPTISAQTTHRIEITDRGFLPETITIELEDSIEWTWISGTHNVRGERNLFLSGTPVPPPNDWSFTFSANLFNEGRYEYSSDTDPRIMRGSIIIGDGGGTGDDLGLRVGDLIAGRIGEATVVNGTANGRILIAYSLTGGGPINSPYGRVLLTPPLESYALIANRQGIASETALIPASLSGFRIWFQALDYGTGKLSNGISTVIR